MKERLHAEHAGEGKVAGEEVGNVRGGTTAIAEPSTMGRPAGASSPAVALHVFTARIGFVDPDVIDVTRKSGDALGIHFAPSWGLLAPYLEKRRRGELTDRDWVLYGAGFAGEMDASRDNSPGAWRSLLARPRAVLVCYCANPERCHRSLLARDLLPMLGAIYGGELAIETAQPGLFDEPAKGGRK